MAALLLAAFPVANAGVWAHYSFDTDYQDSSGNGRHGSLTDVGTMGNSGIITSVGNHKFGGGAMDFSDDRDYIAIPSQTFSSGAPYTIAFWAQRNSASRTWDMIIGERDTIRFFIGAQSNGTIRWRSSNSTAARQHDFTAAADTAWHHYAIVAESSNVRFYRDGSLVTTATGKQTGFILNSIGAAYTAGDFDFQGRIDEMWILDEAADASMISDIYTSNDPGISGPDITPDPSVTKLHVVLVGGQSNADGRAVTSGLPTSPDNLQMPQDDVDFFYKVEGGSATLTTLRPGLSESGQFGPSITLGHDLANLYQGEANSRVAVIKYANGGTNLYSQWKAGGDATTSGDGPEYVIFQQTVSTGLAQLAIKYPNATIAHHGMLWVQGESDANNATNANAYQANLTAFIADVRMTIDTELPFYISRLSSGQTAINATHLATIRAGQAAVDAADSRTAIIDTDGFGVKGDNMHFDSSGQQAIGDSAANISAYYRWMLDTFSTADINAGKGEPTADPDGDGKNNEAEFLGQSSPLDATSHFKAWITLPDSSTVMVHYNSSIYRQYAVEKYNLITEVWDEIVSFQPGDGGEKSFSTSSATSPQLFRVVSQLR